MLIKPDGATRGLVGESTERFERKGLKIVGLKMIHIDDELATRHYAEHKGKEFYEGLVSFITSGPTVAMVLETRFRCDSITPLGVPVLPEV